MMSSDEERISSPVLPKDSDRGSSVSSGLQDEYEELLRYAVVTPKWVSDSPKQSHCVTRLSTGNRGSNAVPDDQSPQHFAGATLEERHENAFRQQTADIQMVSDKPDAATVKKLPEDQEVHHRTPALSVSNTDLPVGPLTFSKRTSSHLLVSRKPEMSDPVCQLSIPAENLDKVENILNTASDQLKVSKIN
ncbi:centrosomal protein POC5-like [Rhincodon typus]|uniref:centrosomal protein POC5-like n=1 Tax=Rhincodon typus TaxID=259920 RepID=UPI00202F2334|nr:centrosomal protein POC5-like [Rhincodon typus]